MLAAWLQRFNFAAGGKIYPLGIMRKSAVLMNQTCKIAACAVWPISACVDFDNLSKSSPKGNLQDDAGGNLKEDPGGNLSEAPEVNLSEA